MGIFVVMVYVLVLVITWSLGKEIEQLEKRVAELEQRYSESHDQVK